MPQGKRSGPTSIPAIGVWGAGRRHGLWWGSRWPCGGHCGRVWPRTWGRCGRVRMLCVCMCEKGGPVAGPPFVVCRRRCPTLPHPGGCSTIGAGSLSFRVRKGKRSGRVPAAVAAATLAGPDHAPARGAGVGFGYRIADACRFDLPPSPAGQGGVVVLGRSAH